ncbi:hypothetical protein [Deinococcus misasensis]|uniref:hypothetical protein n=1 Tax=Deinococcus misasensis TaxID=392413 RepID=UPI00055408C0|nr:hypothetical protein [Deinococcus misasensis]
MAVQNPLLQTVSGTYTSQGISEAIEVTAHPDRYEFQTSRTTVELSCMNQVWHADDTEPDCVIQFPIVFPLEEERRNPWK